MTRKRFMKLLMGKFGFNKYDARMAGWAVTIKGTIDGIDFMYHQPNVSYKQIYDYYVNVYKEED